MDAISHSFDLFMCVHERDIQLLFEIALRSYMLNFLPKRNLILISNNKPRLQEFLNRVDLAHIASVTSDTQWLTKQEQALPGWYRQQIIKLRAYEFCTSPYICSMGADTILLRPIEVEDLICNNRPVLYYNRYPNPNPHFAYEQQRVNSIAQILQVIPTTSSNYVDFILDLFCFERDFLISLHRYLQVLYGYNYFYAILKNRGSTLSDKMRFGEWTLYSVYVLDCLKANVCLRNSASKYLCQIHEERSLMDYQFDSKVVHFVDKSVNVNYIQGQLVKRGLLPGKQPIKE